MNGTVRIDVYISRNSMAQFSHRTYGWTDLNIFNCYWRRKTASYQIRFVYDWSLYRKKQQKHPSKIIALLSAILFSLSRQSSSFLSNKYANEMKPIRRASLVKAQIQMEFLIMLSITSARNREDCFYLSCQTTSSLSNEMQFNSNLWWNKCVFCFQPRNAYSVFHWNRVTALFKRIRKLHWFI